MTPLSTEILWTVFASERGFKILVTVEIDVKVTLWRTFQQVKATPEDLLMLELLKKLKLICSYE